MSSAASAVLIALALVGACVLFALLFSGLVKLARLAAAQRILSLVPEQPTAALPVIHLDRESERFLECVTAPLDED